MCQEAKNAKEKIISIDNSASELSDYVYDWITTHKDSNMLLCEYNKDGKLLAAVNSNDTIYLFSKSCQSVMYAPRLTFSKFDHGHLHINDIAAKQNNIGNGSILMKALLNYAKINRVTLITGDISSIDHDHIDRLRHYYKKFGFYITDNSIRKEIGE